MMVTCPKCGAEYNGMFGGECPSCGAKNGVAKLSNVMTYRVEEVICKINEIQDVCQLLSNESVNKKLRETMEAIHEIMSCAKNYIFKELKDNE